MNDALIQMRGRGWPKTLMPALFGAYYATIYAPVAIILTFFPVWMKSRGLVEAEIGSVVAFGTILRVATNPLCGFIADWSGRRKQLLLVLIGGTIISSTFYLEVTDFRSLLIAYLFTNLFWSSVMPLGDSLVLPTIRRLDLDYGRARRWGSISVIAVSLGLGLIVDRGGAGVVALPLVGAFTLLFLVVLAIPGGSDTTRVRAPAPLRKILQRSDIWLLLGSGAVCQGAHGIFYSFGTFYWLLSGLSPAVVGVLWAIGVIAEICAFSISGRLIQRWGGARMIAVACCVGVVRWTVLALDGDLAAAVVVQVLQAGTLGLAQAGVASYLSRGIPEDLMSSATGVYYACSYGLFTAGSVLVGGYLFAALRGHVFFIASSLCAFGAICALLLAKREGTAAKRSGGQNDRVR